MTKQEIFDKIAALMRTQTETVTCYREMSGLCSPIGVLCPEDKWFSAWDHIGARQLLDDVPEYFREFLDPEETVDQRWETTRMICELEYAFEESYKATVALTFAEREGYLKLIAATRGCTYVAPT